MDKSLIDELEKYFSSRQLPKSVILGPGETVTDIPRFIEAQLTRLKTYPDSTLTQPCLDRLEQLKKRLGETKDDN